MSFLSVIIFSCPKTNSEHSDSDVPPLGKARVQLKVTSHYGVLGGLGAMGKAERGKYANDDQGDLLLTIVVDRY